ncbi:MAG: SNF2-related protein [Bacillota bacterium]
MNVYDMYQARYFAEQLLLKRESGKIENLMGTLASAKVDLNPHQIDAVLFAFASPLSKGVLLADEVGLGKTIEAGIAIAQYFAENKKKIVLIVPASLRNQWLAELDEKFGIKSVILESKNYNQILKNEMRNPFLCENKVVICSYNFASAKKDDIEKIKWDLAIMDEAHRLRNVYKSNNKIGNNLKNALQDTRKILLTATPLQNNLMELYGLVSILDDKVFSDVKTFRDKYIHCKNEEVRNHFLKLKIANFCKRTLRKQVVEYVPYTKREAILTEYAPTDKEEELYNKVSAYLQENTLYALPNSQRSLMTMILRKLLASSSFAIATTLDALVTRLEDLLLGVESELSLGDFDSIDELLEEVGMLEQEFYVDRTLQKEVIEKELSMLKEYAALAKSITINAKGQNLLIALEKGFDRVEELGGNRKVVIFTESRRTQEYLFNLLSNNGYAEKIVFLNGTNTDSISKEIYKEWVQRHQGEEIVSGSRTADIKSAVVEEFKLRAEILIGTEAAAEGINLQFCSLLVNYDMPWNPQRIEQRIGRCHRYGQKNDVVVLNFVNTSNEADMRVYELLDEKFNLFQGLFGSSDEVLGSIESGIDFESQIAAIYQNCRTTAEIQKAFDVLQQTYRKKIDIGLSRTKQLLLENFDEDVTKLLKVRNDEAMSSLSRYEEWLKRFMILACYKEFQHKKGSRFLHNEVYYNLNWRACQNTTDHFLRKENGVIESILQETMALQFPQATVRFFYEKSKGKISYFENLQCRTGTLKLQKLICQGLEVQEYLLKIAVLDDGQVIPSAMVEKLLEMFAITMEKESFVVPTIIDECAMAAKEEILKEIAQENKKFFLEECNKLNGWGEEMKDRLQEEIKKLDQLIKELKKDIQVNEASYSLEEIMSKQDDVKRLSKERTTRRATLFEEEDKIEDEVTRLQGEIQKRMGNQVEVMDIFTVRFEVK